MHFIFDWNQYKEKAREVCREGCVLLKNDRQALPLAKGTTVSVFGRIQLDYWYMKSGTGSGGLVNAPYAIGIADGLREAGIGINEELVAAYEKFEEEHPFDRGSGWSMEPVVQEEMPLADLQVQNAAAASDAAIVVIGRWCGEDHDLDRGAGGYDLTADERDMLAKVTKYFTRSIVLISSGSVIDMKWVKEYDPAAVMYIWQGGQEGGHGIADLLTGKVSPSGKLADTIAENIDDYPSTAHFGDPDRNLYVEDIYVGYRYFETFAKDKVLYPFGYGLSYTSFDERVTGFGTVSGPESGWNSAEGAQRSGNEDALHQQIRVSVEVMNDGSRSGKETVQVYWKAPEDAALTGAARNLAGFAKTRTLAPGESETLQITFPVSSMASYDDSGVTGHKSAWVIPAGVYEIYAGSDVRRAAFAGQYRVADTIVVQQCEEALSPVVPFQRMKNDHGTAMLEDVPQRDYDLAARIRDRRPEDRPCTGDRGIRLSDVRKGKNSMEEFLDQISDVELIRMSRGEGMCSPKVTPGIAGAMGGVTEGLKKFGIPVAGVSDGPSGIRRDNGAMAFSNPNGVMIACTFNEPLIRELYAFQGMELRRSHIDALLGPGINIHRNPLNGRNFEYFSEDPFLAGTMAAAELTAMREYGETGTVKHFFCNSQEYRRAYADAVVSERAAREIYLKPFEMAVKKGKTTCIMTMYGPINGIRASSNYDLNTTILRKDWGYQGLVMTDWRAEMNEEGEAPSRENTAVMIRAQNDVYMVSPDSEENGMNDNAEQALADGVITRGELLRNAANICRVVMNMPCENFLEGQEDAVVEMNRPKDRNGTRYELGEYDISEGPVDLDVSGLHTEAGSDNQYTIHGCEPGDYRVEVTLSSTADKALSQVNVSLIACGIFQEGFTLFGSEKEPVTKVLGFDGYTTHQYLDLFFAQDGAKVQSVRVCRVDGIYRQSAAGNAE